MWHVRGAGRFSGGSMSRRRKLHNGIRWESSFWRLGRWRWGEGGRGRGERGMWMTTRLRLFLIVRMRRSVRICSQGCGQWSWREGGERGGRELWDEQEVTGFIDG